MDDQFEVYLIGTGNYGESVVLNLGMNNWIVVDSCIDPTSKEVLPLSFLKSKGVDIENDVKLIVCTHWHDDHIKGISKILEACKSSAFSMAYEIHRMTLKKPSNLAFALNINDL